MKYQIREKKREICAWINVLTLCLFINACTTQTVAPVSTRKGGPDADHRTQSTSRQPPATSHAHIVKKGDTLYSIAWNYGFDYRDVAAWNGITEPYIIYPDQTINLQAPPVNKVKSLIHGPIVTKKTVSKSNQERPAKQVATKRVPPEIQAKPLLPGKISWSWPVRGKLVKSNTPTAKKGIDIAGKVGQAVSAAAKGDVVYSGGGLLGYGKLIIIKHNDTFLSAYAHNNKLLVREGEQVKAGQMIAQMGKTRSGHALLHFEIRKNGKPINPLDYLPN